MTAIEIKMIDRLHIAEMTTSVGALVLGIGLGAFIASSLRDLAVGVFFVGLALHAWGMWDQHHIETRLASPEPVWARAMFWGCWIMLVGVLGWFGVTRLA